jgi:hypothetical protein
MSRGGDLEASVKEALARHAGDSQLKIREDLGDPDTLRNLYGNVFNIITNRGSSGFYRVVIVQPVEVARVAGREGMRQYIGEVLNAASQIEAALVMLGGVEFQDNSFHPLQGDIRATLARRYGNRKDVVEELYFLVPPPDAPSYRIQMAKLDSRLSTAMRIRGFGIGLS